MNYVVANMTGFMYVQENPSIMLIVLWKCEYVIVNDYINALKRMLIIMFELGIDWYANKGQCSSIANKMIYSGMPICSPMGQYRWCTQNANVK